MERVTISVSDEFARALSEFMAAHGYDNRSEALRDLARAGLERARQQAPEGACVAAVTYAYNHRTRALARRLTETHHHRHDLTTATLHVHLDHEHCLEVAVVQGDAAEVKAFAESVITERGVVHGQVAYVPVTVHAEAHAHEGGNRTGRHVHIRPGSV